MFDEAHFDQDRTILLEVLDGSPFNPSDIKPLVITSGVSIIGPEEHKLTISGKGEIRVLDIPTSDPVRLENLTITRGNSYGGSGGGIRNTAGDLTLSHVVMHDNYSGGGGGGALYHGGGSLAVYDSTFFSNLTASAGGAIEANGDTVDITGSTFHNNTSYTVGGGLYVASDAGIRNSTFSENHAPTGGGGIYTDSNTPHLTRIKNSTIANNTTHANLMYEPGGAGISSYSNSIWTSSPTLLVNSIVYGNTNTYDNSGTSLLEGDVRGDFDDNSSHNLIGVIGGDAGLMGLDDASNRVGPAYDPQLLDLGNYGGPTPTHALEAGSPAIDQGSLAHASGLATDQRGFVRVQDGGNGPLIDIGAYELGSTIVCRYAGRRRRCDRRRHQPA